MTPRPRAAITGPLSGPVIGVRRDGFGPRDRVVVVGGGPAGWSAAKELRRLGFAGEVVVVTAEPTGPYDRTACSKGLLNGHQRPKDLRLDLSGCRDVHWRVGERAVGLDLRSRVVLLRSGEYLEFDGLVAAPGTHAGLPPGWPAGEPGMHLLHTVADAWGLRHDLRLARRVAVVGAGLTGCEVACAVRALARDAVLVNSQSYVMARSVGEPVGALVTEAHRAAGVETRMGRRVTTVQRHRGGWRLLLDDGDAVSADLVVVTAGERPDVDWLSDAGLNLDDGVLCDESLRVVGAEGVVAAGAAARWPNLRYGPQPVRVGQWIAAVEQGQAAARTLLRGPSGAEPVTLLPRFWSDQAGLRIQVAGQLDADAEVSVTELRPGRRDVARAGVVASYSRYGRLVGMVAVNAPRAFAVATRTLLSMPVEHAAALPAGRWLSPLPAGRPALPSGRPALPSGRPALPAGRPALPASSRPVPALPAGASAPEVRDRQPAAAEPIRRWLHAVQ